MARPWSFGNLIVSFYLPRISLYHDVWGPLHMNIYKLTRFPDKAIFLRILFFKVIILVGLTLKKVPN